ncbi:hypothetical protein BGW38_008767 [Lunasporangiospora selenospora]|uniref:DUF3533 domain-containing protein n=1 Tax=Lunasporangiospora selenospora TaxID=979761 RepID=A0A9P6KG62_9FUNG|nr:hypothetical protein BGW38_008767 [Lunasporangiospora selenospora]
MPYPRANSSRSFELDPSATNRQRANSSRSNSKTRGNGGADFIVVNNDIMISPEDQQESQTEDEDQDTTFHSTESNPSPPPPPPSSLQVSDGQRSDSQDCSPSAPLRNTTNLTEQRPNSVTVANKDDSSSSPALTTAQEPPQPFPAHPPPPPFTTVASPALQSQSQDEKEALDLYYRRQNEQQQQQQQQQQLAPSEYRPVRATPAPMLVPDALSDATVVYHPPYTPNMYQPSVTHPATPHPLNPNIYNTNDAPGGSRILCDPDLEERNRILQQPQQHSPSSSSRATDNTLVSQRHAHSARGDRTSRREQHPDMELHDQTNSSNSNSDIIGSGRRGGHTARANALSSSSTPIDNENATVTTTVTSEYPFTNVRVPSSHPANSPPVRGGANQSRHSRTLSTSSSVRHSTNHELSVLPSRPQSLRGVPSSKSRSSSRAGKRIPSFFHRFRTGSKASRTNRHGPSGSVVPTPESQSAADSKNDLIGLGNRSPRQRDSGHYQTRNGVLLEKHSYPGLDGSATRKKGIPGKDGEEPETDMFNFIDIMLDMPERPRGTQVFLKLIKVLVVMSVSYFALMALYFGAEFQADSNVKNFNIMVVDMDRGMIGVQFKNFVQLLNKQPAQPNWVISDNFTSVDQVKANVESGEFWGAVVVQKDASFNLNRAFSVPLPDYDPRGAFLFIYDGGRDPLAVKPYIVANMYTQFLQFSQIFNPAWVRFVIALANNNGVNLTALGDAPQVLGTPVAFQELDLHPITAKIVTSATSVAYIWIFLVAGGSTYFVANMIQPVTRETTVARTIAYLLSPLSFYLVIFSLTYTLLLFLFGVPFSSGAQFMSLFAGMLMLQLAVASLVLFLMYVMPVVYIPVFTITFVVLNVIAVFNPIELMPKFYRWAYAMPFLNAVQVARHVLMGSNNRLVYNLPILAAWILIPLGLLPFAIKRQKKATEEAMMSGFEEGLDGSRLPPSQHSDTIGGHAQDTDLECQQPSQHLSLQALQDQPRSPQRYPAGRRSLFNHADSGEDSNENNHVGEDKGGDMGENERVRQSTDEYDPRSSSRRRKNGAKRRSGQSRDGYGRSRSSRHGRDWAFGDGNDYDRDFDNETSEAGGEESEAQVRGRGRGEGMAQPGEEGERERGGQSGRARVRRSARQSRSSRRQSLTHSHSANHGPGQNGADLEMPSEVK